MTCIRVISGLAMKSRLSTASRDVGEVLLAW